MGAQGYEIKQKIVFQDNHSAIKMEKNGKKPFTSKSRHIDIQNFFAKDTIESNNMSIVYCIKEHMHADFFTKSLRGA